VLGVFGGWWVFSLLARGRQPKSYK